MTPTKITQPELAPGEKRQMPGQEIFQDFQKRETAVTAVQLTMDNYDAVCNALFGDWKVGIEEVPYGQPTISVQTMYCKTEVASIGDWIVKDITFGTYHVVKDDDFVTKHLIPSKGKFRMPLLYRYHKDYIK